VDIAGEESAGKVKEKESTKAGNKELKRVVHQANLQSSRE
jgi:hypothetical protein